jgi:uncharacterized membrane protein YoaK (UPF0700 family)
MSVTESRRSLKTTTIDMNSGSTPPHRVEHADATGALTPGRPTPTGRRARLARRRPSDTRLRDMLLVALTLAWGSIDAISFAGLGRVYSAFQTGNVIVLGLGTSGASGVPVLRAGVSLATFGFGVLVATRIVGHPSAAVVWPRRLESVLVAIGAVLTGFLVFWIVVNGRPSSTSADLLIAISAFGAGMETGAIFRLGVRAVFTTAATATVTAFVSDVDDDLTRQRSAVVDQGRLLLVIVAAFAGACAGGALLVNVRDIAPILAPTLTLAVAATARFAFGPAPSVAERSTRPDTAPAT